MGKMPKNKKPFVSKGNQKYETHTLMSEARQKGKCHIEKLKESDRRKFTKNSR